MKKSKRVISLLLSLIMVLSVCQTGFVAVAADSTQYVLDAEEAKQLADAGAVATATQVVRVAKGLNSFEPGTMIVPATPSGIPDMGERTLANAGNVQEEAKYPEVKIIFKELPSGVPQVSCVNSNSITNNVVMNNPIVNEAEKSYTWTIASGTANAGDTLKFNITYTYNGKNYTSVAYSYVEGISQPAGSYISTETKYRDVLRFKNYYSDVSAATRVLGINTYGSLESFATSSTDRRGYYNAGDLNQFVLKTTMDYAMYSAIRDTETKTKNETINYLINDRRSYADVYVDTSVTKSFADLNLRYAVAKIEQRGGNSTQELDAVVVQPDNVNVSANSLNGTGNAALGNLYPSTGTMGLGDQYVTTFTGQTFIDGAEYTIITKLSSSYSGAVNHTYFPVGLRVHTVDKGELRTLINDILHNYTPENPTTSATRKGVNPQSWYYSAGFSAYEKAMLAAQTILLNPRASQDEIDSAVTSLESAYSGLVLAEADYSKVAVAIGEANKNDASLYTPKSYAELMQAISVYDATTNPDGKIQYGFSVLFQPQVDEWEAEIYDAIEALEYRSADYDELNALITKAEDAIKNSTLYESDGLIDVQNALNAIDKNVKITEQSKVDKMADDLREALSKLKYIGADYSEVDKAIMRAGQHISSNYTPESYANLRNVMTNIDRTLNVTQQTIVDGYVTQIEEAIAALEELPANYATLESLLAKFNSLDKSHYEEVSYKNASDAAAACEGYEKIGITRQDEINAMAESLRSAIDALIMLDANYDQVNYWINMFNEMDKNQISDDSISNVERVINSVEPNLKADRQNIVDGYAEAIEKAIKNIKFKEADYTEVILAEEEAKKVDRTLYTADSLTALDVALARVKRGLGVNRQSEVDAMADDIREAISKLAYGPGDYTEVENAIAMFEEKDHSHYTLETVENVRAAIKAVNYELTRSPEDQGEITKYANRILTAVLALKEAKADYTELNKIIETKPQNLDLYTHETVTVLEAVENNIDWDLPAAEQYKVIGYQNALTEAIANLKYLPGDYSEVDAEIENGLAIIEKNDPPISQESIDAFHELINSIDRTYTIIQVAEIKALALQIKTAYDQFSYSEAIKKASISLVADKSVACPGDIVTVSVVLGTDYYAASSSIPVVYDRYYYKLVGSTVEEAFAFEGSYAASAVTGGNINSPAKGYPASYTETDKDQWKYALVTFRTDSNVTETSHTAQILDPAQIVVTLKFEVLNSVTVGNNKARIWVDEAFLKTKENKTGKLFIGRYETEVVNNNVTTVGQSIDLTNAIVDLSIKNPNDPASYTELEEALGLKPAYEKSFYTTTSYDAYNAAVKVGRELYMANNLTIKDQYIIDNATNDIIDAYNALELLPADTERLVEALKLILDLPLKPGTTTGEKFEDPSEVYTEDSLSAYESAYSVGQAIYAEENLTVADNQRIQQAAENIEKAYANLTYHPFKWADDMEAALELSPEHPEDVYTTDSYEAFENAKSALEDFKNSDPTFLKNDEGRRLILALEWAFEGLEYESADLSELEAAINKTLDYDSSFYTDETYAEYESAINAGKAIINNIPPLTILEQETVQAAIDDINNAIEQLDFKDFSYWDIYDSIVNEDEKWFYDLPDDAYTWESYDRFWAAFEDIVWYFEPVDIRSDEEFLELVAALEYARDNMEIASADTDEFYEALALEAEVGTNRDIYEDPVAYDEFMAAIKAAKDADDARGGVWPEIDQDLVYELTNAIIEAKGNLKVKAGDYTEVNNAIDAANKKIEEVQKLADMGAPIVDGTLEALKAAIAAVKEGLDIRYQDEIDDYASAIIEATNALDNVSTILPADGSGLYFEEDNVYGYTYLRGFKRFWPIRNEEYITSKLTPIGSNTRIVVIPVEGNKYGTGTIVEHYDGDELIKRYYIVVDGDLDGDSSVDATDVGLLTNNINEFLEPGMDSNYNQVKPWLRAAADLCKDGAIDVIDLAFVISIANYDDYYLYA